ncbi:MAG TPA: LCP family protein [Clostridia bacterium]|nr:LCP family protein [Clostridia bacterium]
MNLRANRNHSASKTKKRAERRGDFALFFFAFFICILFFGILGFAFSRSFGSSQKSSDLQTASETFTTEFSEKDSRNILFVICGDDSQSVSECVLIRMDAVKKKIAVLPIPPESEMKQGDHSSSFCALFRSSGINLAKTALAQRASVAIDFYCVLKSSDYIRMIDSLGGVIYDVRSPVTADISGTGAITVTKGRQNLSGTKSLALISDPEMKTDASRALLIQAELVKSFLGQKMTGYYLESATDLYKNVFDSAATDFSMNDLLDSMKLYQLITRKADSFVQLAPVFSTAAQDDFFNSYKKVLQQYYK